MKDFPELSTVPAVPCSPPSPLSIQVVGRSPHFREAESGNGFFKVEEPIATVPGSASEVPIPVTAYAFGPDLTANTSVCAGSRQEQDRT